MGDLFERTVQSVKKCLRKTIGSVKLTYNELATALTEVFETAVLCLHREYRVTCNPFRFNGWLSHSQSSWPNHM